MTLLFLEEHDFRIAEGSKSANLVSLVQELYCGGHAGEAGTYDGDLELRAPVVLRLWREQSFRCCGREKRQNTQIKISSSQWH